MCFSLLRGIEILDCRFHCWFHQVMTATIIANAKRTLKLCARATAKSACPAEKALMASDALPLSRTCSRTEAPVEANRVAIADINSTAAPSAEPAATVSVVGRVTYRKA